MLERYALCVMNKGKIYYARHIERGLAGYGEDHVLIDDAALTAMDASFAGCPVYLGHRLDDVVDVTEEAVGYVVRSFLNRNDGAHWAEFVITTDEGERAIFDGARVSNSYKKLRVDDTAGMRNGINYVQEILEGSYEHLALVFNPRYEGSVVMTPDQFELYNEEKRAAAKHVINSLPEKGEKMEEKTIKIGDEEMGLDELIRRYSELKSKVEGHKEFEKEEEQLEEREEEFMDNKCSGGSAMNEEVDSKKHEDDMEALDRRIADSVKREFEARLSDKEFWRKHIASLEERKKDDESAEREYKKDRAENSILGARAAGSIESKDVRYWTKSDAYELGRQRYGRTAMSL